MSGPTRRPPATSTPPTRRAVRPVTSGRIAAAATSFSIGRPAASTVTLFDPDYEGVLQSDGYGAYPNYCKGQAGRGKRVRRAACLAHIRRKFEAAKDERPEVVGWVLRIMARLYRIETPLRDYEASAEVRARVRENRSRPLIRLLEKAFKYLRTTRILPKSRLGRALDYALG